MKILNNLDNILISEEVILRKAMINLDKNGLQILLLKNKKNVLKGVLTDGDIRRFIMKDGSMDLPVSEIANKKFIKVYN